MSHTRRTLLAAAATVPLAGCAGAWEGVEEDVAGDENDTEDGSTDLENPDALNEADEVVAVGPEQDVEFDPDSIEVDPGTVVGFRWDSGGHTIDVRNQPEDASWQGVPNSQDEGHVHIHTFDVEGQYDYYCGAHQQEGEQENAEDDPGSQGEAQILVGIDPEDVEDEGADGNESDGNESDDEAEGGNPEGDQPQSPNEEDVDEEDGGGNDGGGNDDGQDGGNETDS